MADNESEVLLCCFLWACDGEAVGLSRYEDAVLDLIPEHGGQVVQRVQSDGSEGRPNEVQLFRFDSQASLNSYLADPRREAMAQGRDRVIAKTELFPIRFL